MDIRNLIYEQIAKKKKKTTPTEYTNVTCYAIV